MMWDPAAAQELLDALFAKAAELDEWDRQRAQEDERRESKRCDTPVDFMGLNNRTCRWPLFEGRERSADEFRKPLLRRACRARLQVRNCQRRGRRDLGFLFFCLSRSIVP
jgi:hypothetical protein